MVHGAVNSLDIDDGWGLEDLPETSPASETESEPEIQARTETEVVDDGWSLEEVPERSEAGALREPERRRGNIVRLPGKVVIYPRRAVREKKLSSFWRSALAEGS